MWYTHTCTTVQIIFNYTVHDPLVQNTNPAPVQYVHYDKINLLMTDDEKIEMILSSLFF